MDKKFAYEDARYKAVWLDEACRIPWEELKRANRRYEESREKAERRAMYRRCVRHVFLAMFDALLEVSFFLFVFVLLAMSLLAMVLKAIT